MEFKELREKVKKMREDDARRKELSQKAATLLDGMPKSIDGLNQKQEALAAIQEELDKEPYIVSWKDCLKDWEPYAKKYNKEFTSKLDEFTRLKTAFLKAYVELAELQNEGIHQWNTFCNLWAGLDIDREGIPATDLKKAPVSTEKEILYMEEQAALDNYLWLEHVMKEQRYMKRDKDSRLGWMFKPFYIHA